MAKDKEMEINKYFKQVKEAEEVIRELRMALN